VYYITKKTDKTPLKAILALLNSRLYFAWLYNRGKRKGEALELYQVPLTEIPIPTMENSQISTLTEAVNEILKAVKLGDEKLISSLERTVDQVVYAIFKLSPQDISSVEDFWNKKRSKFEILDKGIEETISEE